MQTVLVLWEEISASTLIQLREMELFFFFLVNGCIYSMHLQFASHSHTHTQTHTDGSEL